MENTIKVEFIWGAKRSGCDGENIIHYSINGEKKILFCEGIAEEGSPNYEEAINRADSKVFDYSLSEEYFLEQIEKAECQE